MIDVLEQTDYMTRVLRVQRSIRAKQTLPVYRELCLVKAFDLVHRVLSKVRWTSTNYSKIYALGHLQLTIRYVSGQGFEQIALLAQCIHRSAVSMRSYNES